MSLTTTCKYQIVLHDLSTPPYYCLHEVSFDENSKRTAWKKTALFVHNDGEFIHDALVKALHDLETLPLLKESDLDKRKGKERYANI